MTRNLIFAVIAALLGTLEASAAGLVFKADLTGAQEVPPVVTATSGTTIIRADVAHTQLVVDLSVRDGSGILGAAGAHIHCAPAGQNGPVVAFLAGVVPGGLDGRLDLRLTLTAANIVNPACGSTIAELIQSFVGGLAYINVHSLANPAGEVRGQIYQNRGGR